ncbi:amidase family protein [Pelagicoccus sp. SDUM812003]|uniref:amidase family protein n=1 Tax=Pelagicoccus sp. SDUM812003 TaxID=3041267 RepID=UPI00280E3A62|nr:amidase family protein [Pelagicoccus sp. SDUM812003]MDQ8204672.1 amidase family protein [Pelagicoccus sp. SDUM812003]
MIRTRLATSFIVSIFLIVSAYAEKVKIPLHEATILDIQNAFDQGTLTSEKLIRMYLKRIEAYDQKGPSLNALLTLNEDAIAEAKKLDAERKKSGPRSLLHGIPIIPKDNFDTMDLATTGGFKGLEGSVPVRDAFTIRRLREAGAIILAKSNLDEFNSGSSGTSGLGGQVLNPYNLEKVPGGSSAGSGAAIAAVFGQVGLGTETGSSIRNPSTKNNLVGIASTNGLVSRAGIVPSSIILDRAGPMARSVTDAAIVLHGMAGMDAADLTTIASIGKLPKEGYLSYLDEEALNGARIGVLRANFGSDPEDEEALAQIEAAIEALSEKGATLIDPLPVGEIDMFKMLRTVSGSRGERMEAMNHYLAGRGPDVPVKTLKDIADSGLALGKLQEGFERALEEPPMYFNENYANFVRNREAFKRLVLSWYDDYELDAIIYPYQTKPAYTIEQAVPEGGAVRAEYNNYDVMGRGTRMSTVTGFPGITVPAGFTESDGMPVGLEFLGKPFDEGKLIGLCYAYEQAHPMRKLPATTPVLKGEWIEYEK